MATIVSSLRFTILSLSLLVSIGSFSYAATPAPEVMTLSGNGVSGIANGTPEETRFMAPGAVAYDPRTRLTYVSDYAAQSIRAIDADGISSTIAGAGRKLKSGLGVVGGYRDGPGMEAQFNHPMGIAIMADGSLLVADSFNHCIRRIVGGVVSTFAGSATGTGSRDGPIQQATFNEPRGISLDGSGNIYVADRGNGIRKITDTTVSTIVSSAEIISVSATTMAATPTLYYVYNRRAAAKIRLSDGFSTPLVSSSLLPYPLDFDGVQAVDDHTVILTSTRYHVIYIADFACSEPSGICVRVLAGGTDADRTQAGGFADGTLSNSKFYNPVGLALKSGSELILADSGNRRIRMIRFDSFLGRPSNSEAAADALLITGPLLAPFDDSRDGLASLSEKYVLQTYQRNIRFEQLLIAPGPNLFDRLQQVLMKNKTKPTILFLDRQLLSATSSPNQIDLSDIARLQPTPLLQIVLIPLGSDLGSSISEAEAQATANQLQFSNFSSDLEIEKALAALGTGNISSLLSAFVKQKLDGGPSLFTDDGMRLTTSGRAFVAKQIAEKYTFKSEKSAR